MKNKRNANFHIDTRSKKERRLLELLHKEAVANSARPREFLNLPAEICKLIHECYLGLGLGFMDREVLAWHISLLFVDVHEERRSWSEQGREAFSGLVRATCTPHFHSSSAHHYPRLLSENVHPHHVSAEGLQGSECYIRSTPCLLNRPSRLTFPQLISWHTSSRPPNMHPTRPYGSMLTILRTHSVQDKPLIGSKPWVPGCKDWDYRGRMWWWCTQRITFLSLLLT